MTEAFSLARPTSAVSTALRFWVPPRHVATTQLAPSPTDSVSPQPESGSTSTGSHDQLPSSDARTVGTDLLEGQLFDARAQAKQIAAQLSMHLRADWRDKIFKQFDELLSAAEWDAADQPLNEQSVRTFLRFVIFAGVTAVPAMGMTSAGNLLAAWRRDTRRLTIEFQASDRCHALLSHFEGDDQSIVTFTGAAKEARGFLIREAFKLS